MHPDPFFYFRIIFSLCFFGTFLGGIYMLKNFQRFFGVDPDIPSENASQRCFSVMQAFTIWIHALMLFGMAAWYI